MSEPSTVTLKTKLAILSVGLLSFVGILVETSMNVTFPTLIKTMGVSLDTVQWLTTGYLLLTTIVMSTNHRICVETLQPEAPLLICRPRLSSRRDSLLDCPQLSGVIDRSALTSNCDGDLDSINVPADFY